MVCDPAASPEIVTIAWPTVPFATSVGLVTVESTVTATVPPGAVAPDAGVTDTVKVASVPDAA